MGAWPRPEDGALMMEAWPRPEDGALMMGRPRPEDGVLMNGLYEELVAPGAMTVNIYLVFVSSSKLVTILL